MNKTILSINARADTPKEKLHPREFRRMVAVCCRYPGPLLIGLFCTTVFAALHTVSIAAAFPVFKVLLDDEGVDAWADRIIAGERIGADLVLDGDADEIRIASVEKKSDPYLAGLRKGDVFRDLRGRSAREFLHDISHDDGLERVVVVRAKEEAAASESWRKLTLTLSPVSASRRALRRMVGLTPNETPEQKLRTLTYILAGLVVIIIVANVFRYLGEVWISKGILRSMMQLRTELFARTLRLPMSYFATQKTADLVGRFIQDMLEIQRGMLTLFSKFIREPLSAALVLAFAFYLDWRLTLCVVLVAPMLAVIFWQIGRRVKKSNKKLLQAYGEMIDALTTSLQNLRVVKAYTAEDLERKRLRAVDLRVLKQQVKLVRFKAFVSPAIESVSIVAVSFLTLWLAKQVLNQDLDIATFGTLGLALSGLFNPIRRISDVYVRVQRSTAGAQRVFQVIDSVVEGEEFDVKAELKPLRRSIECRHVSFTYPGAETEALSDVSFTIQRGETVALVGPNGCGKTTLVSLLLRMFIPSSGEIRFDGVKINDVGLESLRRQISLVTQEAVVFGTTPAQNIAYGADSPDPDRVRDAARRASAAEFIEAIPGGYDAPLGERGTTLSGGQRQRLAIARAIYRDAPILIFDEATSQVDAESEQEIQRAIREFSKNRTTIIIAHRLSTIQCADRILAMEAGRMIDSGTHEELLERCEMYRTLCETQLVAAQPSG
ncbi:MAG: ABC transporter ATP-binding protein [Planctomycetes bacterium]|nr:ABC transporter ATP-binding protein [Planctomycetota bacterium]